LLGEFGLEYALRTQPPVGPLLLMIILLAIVPLCVFLAAIRFMSFFGSSPSLWRKKSRSRAFVPWTVGAGYFLCRVPPKHCISFFLQVDV